MQFGDSIWKHARWTRMFQTANDLTTVKCGATTAYVHDTHLQPLIAQCEDTMIILTDTGFQESGAGPGQPDLSDETAAVRDRPGGGGRRRQNFVRTLSYIP